MSQACPIDIKYQSYYIVQQVHPQVCQPVSFLMQSKDINLWS